MADHAALTHPLRHPAEIPTFAIMVIPQLPRSHPWTVRRIWRLHQLRLFGGADIADKAPRPLDVV